MDKQKIISDLQEILRQVDEAHSGIMCARSLQTSMKEMMGLPFFPEKTMPIANGFEAINAAHSKIKTLIAGIGNANG